MRSKCGLNSSDIVVNFDPSLSCHEPQLQRDSISLIATFTISSCPTSTEPQSSTCLSNKLNGIHRTLERVLTFVATFFVLLSFLVCSNPWCGPLECARHCHRGPDRRADYHSGHRSGLCSPVFATACLPPSQSRFFPPFRTVAPRIKILSQRVLSKYLLGHAVQKGKSKWVVDLLIAAASYLL